MSFTRAATIALAAALTFAVAVPAAGAATLDLLGIRVEIPTPDLSPVLESADEPEAAPAPAVAPTAPAPPLTEPAPAPPATTAAPAPVTPTTAAPAAPAPATMTTVRRTAAKVPPQVALLDTPTATPASAVPPGAVAAPDAALAAAGTPARSPLLPAEVIPGPAGSSSNRGFVAVLGAMLIRMLAISAWLGAAALLYLAVRRTQGVPAL